MRRNHFVVVIGLVTCLAIASCSTSRKTSRAHRLLAVTIPRSALTGVQWHTADAITIINTTAAAAAAEKSINQKPRTRELQPLNLATEPDLARLVQAVDLADLAGPR